MLDQLLKLAFAKLIKMEKHFSNPINNPESIKAFDLQFNFNRNHILHYESNAITYFTPDTFINKYAKVAIQFKYQGKYDTLIFHDRGRPNEVCSNIYSFWYVNKKL